MAAGHGTRMHSRTPKVLHPVCGRPMLHWTIAAAQEADAAKVVVVVRPGEGVEDALPENVTVAPQTSGEGTGAAVLAARDHVEPAHLAIREINIGAYAFDADALFDALEKVQEEQGERYLTGVFEVFRRGGRHISAHRTEDVLAAQGVNNRRDLMEVERHARRRIIDAHALNGVTFTLPDTVAIDAAVEIGADTTIEPGTVLRGSTSIGSGCTIGPSSTLIDAELGDRVLAAHAYMTTCLVGDDVSIGPFAYLRPGTRIANGAKIGTYVEVKNSTIGERTKVPHLSYLGDADVGADSNIAAGNITANYHRGTKSRTTIGDGVKTGVDTSFVAPVDVGDGAYTAAGSVITDDVPPGALAIARPDQQNIEGYAERVESESRDGKS